MFDFKGKKILVTGGAAGIGFKITELFLQNGAEVVVVDYSIEALKKAEAQLQEFKNKTQFLDCNITDRSAVAQMISKVTGALDVVVNNAGITRDKSFLKMNSEDWDSVINTNLTGLYNVTKAALEKFNPNSQQKRIINISSIVGIFGNFGQSNYAAAKAGVIGLTKTWAKELGRKGFTANAIAPGFIRTAMIEAMPPEVLKSMEAKVPVPRLGETKDIAHACLFLASEQASYINGITLSVDGGLVL